MRKYGDVEKAEPLEEKDEKILEDHVVKTGKTLENLDDDEREELWGELDANRGE